MPADKVRHSTKLFAEKVMPKLQNIWPDYADDNRFWIKPLEKRAVPARLAMEAAQ